MQNLFIDYNKILTKRELEILKFLVKGLSNVEIANETGISTHCVKVHVHSILCKLNVKNRVQATLKAAHFGLVRYEE